MFRRCAIQKTGAVLTRFCRRCFTYRANNEPVLDFAPASKERAALQNAIKDLRSVVSEIPICIGKDELTSSDVRYQVSPFDHEHKLAKFYYATPEMIKKAIDVSLAAKERWENEPLEKRAAVFLKAANYLANEGRFEILAACMLGQAKTPIQAEIDAACELIDFFRFNVQFASELEKYQPISTKLSMNSMNWRSTDGFWTAITPFNFTAIGAHLCSAPALVGNAVVWKPSDTAILSNYVAFKALRRAGLPDGVINFVPADGPTFGATVTESADLCGVNFTGSVKTFRWLWSAVAANLSNYHCFPRLIGECGGKNFHLVHPSADAQTVINGTALSAWEFSGQKCSACSRAYIPESLWPTVRDGLLKIQSEIKMGDPTEFETFMSAVIDQAAFDRIQGYIEHAKQSANTEVIAGGHCDSSKGYFVEPTIILTKDPRDKLMQEEIFGPVLTVYVYPDGDFEKTVDLVKTTSPFGLTGAIFAQDQSVLDSVSRMLRHCAGNLYLNDKSTGSVVGQQPFGGAKLSGTNDKAGGPHYLLRFLSLQAVKHTKVPLKTWRYPSMKA